jgi:hypothetical protein
LSAATMARTAITNVTTATSERTAWRVSIRGRRGLTSESDRLAQDSLSPSEGVRRRPALQPTGLSCAKQGVNIAQWVAVAESRTAQRRHIEHIRATPHPPADRQ